MGRPARAGSGSPWPAASALRAGLASAGLLVVVGPLTDLSTALAAQQDTVPRREPSREFQRTMPPEIWDQSALEEGDSPEARRLARGLWEAYGQALLRGDADAVAAWFAEDAVLMEPDLPDLRGRREILEYVRGVFERWKVTEVEIVPRHVALEDGRLWEMGRFLEAVRLEGEPPESRRGRYAAVWERGADGSWKIFWLLINHAPDG